MASNPLFSVQNLREKAFRRGLAVFLVVLLLPLSLSAWAKDDRRCTLYNSSDWAIVKFMTQDDGEAWSGNWIPGDRLYPGESFELDRPAGGQCEVRVRVISDDRYMHDYLMDFCRGSEIFIENNRISYR